MEKKTLSSAGNLKVSSEVIVKIAELAACEISGVAADNGRLMTLKPRGGIVALFNSPVQAAVSKEAAVINLSIITEQGHKAVNVASSVQESVKSAVQNMTGIPVSKVNVSVVGIMLNKGDSNDKA